jgi:hypothetical protein
MIYDGPADLLLQCPSPEVAHRRRVLIAGNKAAYWGTSAIIVRRRVIRTTREHSVTERAGRYRRDPKDGIEAYRGIVGHRSFCYGGVT